MIAECRLTVAMRDIAHRARLGTESFTDWCRIKFTKIGELFRHARRQDYRNCL
jgi:hypothetical protein